LDDPAIVWWPSTAPAIGTVANINGLTGSVLGVPTYSNHLPGQVGRLVRFIDGSEGMMLSNGRLFKNGKFYPNND
jgi:hypothetical protein